MRNSKEITNQTPEDIYQYYDSLDYGITLRVKNNKYCFIIPRLSIISENDNLEDAYLDIIKQKRDYIRKAVEVDLVKEIPLPRRIREINKLKSELKVFFIKILIVFIIGGMTITLSSALLINKMSFLEEQITSHVKELLKKLEN